MKEFIATISNIGQVTIPPDIRRKLGLAPGDKLTFVLDDVGKVTLRPVRYTVASLRGIVPALPNRETDDFDDQIAEARHARANRTGRNVHSLTIVHRKERHL